MIHRASTWVLATLALGGCSSLAEQPAEAECTDESDCGPGRICDITVAGGICRDANLVPPLRYLGFDIQEGRDAFRAELIGCDREVEDGGASGLAPARGQLTQTFELRAFGRTPIDPDNPERTELLNAEFKLSQPSRLARSPSTYTIRSRHPTELADQTIVPTQLEWPRYHPENALPDQLRLNGFVLWTVTPEPPSEDAVAPAFRYQMIVPPLGEDASLNCLEDEDCCAVGQTCSPEQVAGRCVRPLGRCRPQANPTFSYRFTYDNNCNRTLTGDVVVVPDASNPSYVPVSDNVVVRLRHDDTDGEPRLGVLSVGGPPAEDRDPQCSSNAECIEDEQFCNLDTQQCELALAGRPAGTGATLGGTFAAQVYSYCENLPNSVLGRSFTIGVNPPSELALPSLSFSTDVLLEPISDGSTPPDTELDRDLCIPAMGTPRGLDVTPSGAPVELLGDGRDAYRCCDISCLPANRDAAVMPPPDAPEVCDGSTSSEEPDGRVGSVLQVTLELSELWTGEDSRCLAPDLGPQGVLGALSRNLTCVEGLCAVEAGSNIAAGTVDQPREYTLRLETPVGSLLQSVQTTVLVDDTTPPVDLQLPPRRIVRGFVSLPSSSCQVELEEDGDCGSEGARVIAERLRMPTETTGNTPGPYFHAISTFYDPIEDRDGAYVLPLDPGVWIITALPQTGTRGGPGGLLVVDLRDEETTELPVDFTLDDGILVTLDVRSFDFNSVVVPLDTGSWTGDFSALEHPARLDQPAPDRYLDLNDPEECLSSPGEEDPPGCQIRRLIPGSSLPLTQARQVRFTTRAAGDDARRRICIEP